MSRLALKNKAKREPKFPCRQYNRCPCCGRVRGFCAVSYVSYLLPFSQPARGYSWCDEV